MLCLVIDVLVFFSPCLALTSSYLSTWCRCILVLWEISTDTPLFLGGHQASYIMFHLGHFSSFTYLRFWHPSSQDEGG
ncbi:hypothetical protein B0H65DRAFT_480118 [Neurospora tetraspora]|uniref:Secreted protein n=1 Tax=Neurospora tetraspora TaxID=94610 RepID=A0AAE0J0S9_9PEZI|nr:hypothetical protein B0H65DRAFT_480118 [Neurospora tetraspora]